jgi:hypothetical protein
MIGPSMSPKIPTLSLMLPHCAGSIHRSITALVLLAIVVFSPLHNSLAQPPERLIDQPPFDELVLSDEYMGKRFQIEEVIFPNGFPPPNPAPTEVFQFRFYEDSDDLYEVSWKDIKEYTPFAKRVLEQTRGYVQSGNFSAAYDNLIHLKANYPKFPGVDELHQEFLYRNTLAFMEGGRVAEALALIEELSFSDPTYRPSASDRTAKELVNVLADRLIGETLSERQYESTRIWIERFTREYGPNALPAVVTRREQLAEASRTLMSEAIAHVNERRFRRGKELLRQALRAWPENPEIVQVAKRIDDEFPTVVVAVRSFPARPDMTSLTNWDARRWGRLADQRLFEYSRLGAEGGDYACTIGKSGMSEDGSEFVIDVAPNRAMSRGLTGYDVSQMLLELANPQSKLFSPAWARLIDRVRVVDVNQVRVHFRKPHPVPAAYLAISLAESPASQLTPLFAPNPSTAANTEFERSFQPTEAGRSASRIVELIEKRFDDPREMVNALINGEVEVVDRIHLGDLPRISGNPQFSVRQYLLPTTHFIAVNTRTPHMKNRSFRRALAYSINCQAMLDGLVLDGQTAPGCRLISGPFPAGMGPTDPIAYAYDDTIAPRPYDPRLGLILFALARKDLEAIAKAKEPTKEEAKPEPPPATKPDDAAKPADAAAPDDPNKPIPPKPREKIPLILAYPQTPAAQGVCGAIAAQLDLVGIDCKLRPLPPGEVEDPTHDYDLLYVEAAMWEPLSDTRRLFAPTGVAPTSSPYINADLRRLDEARSWQEVATRLQQLHRTIYDEVPLIPLWQTYDFAAVRVNLKNVAQRPIWLYGDIMQWQLAAEVTLGGAK